MAVPDLMGKRYSQVRSLLRGVDLNFTPVFDPDVIDTPGSYVTRQNPQKFTQSASGGKKYNRIKPGETIDIWLSTRPLINDSTNNKSDEDFFCLLNTIKTIKTLLLCDILLHMN
ncbi:MAG: PASTA domain-containing protein [Segetibacter sp.]